MRYFPNASTGQIVTLAVMATATVMLFGHTLVAAHNEQTTPYLVAAVALMFVTTVYNEWLTKAAVRHTVANDTPYDWATQGL